MSGKYITLSLKVPTRPPTLLHILENSLLEAIVDYKPLEDGVDPRAVRSRDVRSAYQLKGDVSVIEDELQVQFVAKNVGLHVARIFANTKEVCHPVSFSVTGSGKVHGLDAPPPKQGLDSVDIRRSKYVGAPQSAATTVANSASSTVRAVESEHRLSHGISPPNSPRHTINAPSLSPQQNSQTVFEKLLSKKEATAETGGGAGNRSTRTSTAALTAEMFRSLVSETKVKQSSKFGHKVKARCDLCLRKTKLSKSVSLLGNTFCDPCFTNMFLLRSAIDHFMPPTIKESIIQVPMNKRRTKFTSITKELPDINLKGLTPITVRAAQAEFKKFDIEGDGWLDKVILLPLMKACLSSSISEPTIRKLLTGNSLQSMMATMELGRRDSIHEIEFLFLMAFVTRESLRILQDMQMSSRFTHHDLAMAYAYQNQRVKSRVYSPSSDPISPPSAPVSKDKELLEGVRQSFNESSPLSQYNPTSTEPGHDLSPFNFISDGDSNMVAGLSSPQQQQNSNDKEEQVYTDREGEGNETTRANEEMVDNDEQPEQQPLTPPETPNKHKTKQKGTKNEIEETLKITGDKKADGWMMY